MGRSGQDGRTLIQRSMISKMQIGHLVLFAFFVLSFFRCTNNSSLSSTLGAIPFPKENVQTDEKIELGRKLFFDKRLSIDNSVSCSSCHIPELAFTDGKKLSLGFHGRNSMRNAPTLLNVAYNHTLMFDGEIPTLEMQAVVPLKDTAEMSNDMKDLIQKLKLIPEYNESAQDIFGRDFDAYVLTRSLASFQRSLISDQTPWDKYVSGDKTALNESEIRGWNLFSDKLYCTKCHTPPLFTNFKTENNGLYKSYTDIEDKGRFRINGDSSEIGHFKVPTLRNISLTAPYMHDGSVNSLSDVIDHYQKGGNHHKNQHAIIQPFILSKNEKLDLIAFLKSITDPK